MNILNVSVQEISCTKLVLENDEGQFMKNFSYLLRKF